MIIQHQQIMYMYHHEKILILISKLNRNTILRIHHFFQSVTYDDTNNVQKMPHIEITRTLKVKFTEIYSEDSN